MTKFKINKGFITQKLGKKLVVFDSKKSVIYTLNETASFIFQKIKSGWNKEKILNKIEEKYDVTSKRAMKDYDKIIADLLNRKILLVNIKS